MATGCGLKVTRDAKLQTSLAGLIASLPGELSRLAYKGDWARYAAWCKHTKLDITKAKPRHVEAYGAKLRGEGKTRATCGRALSVIRAVYGAFVRDELMESNPAREVKMPRSDQAPKSPWLKEEEIKKLLALPTAEWEDHRDYAILCLLFGLGWRRAEVARMRVEDFTDHTVTGVLKGGKRVTVGVPPWVSKVIEKWCERAEIMSGPLFPRAEGGAVGYCNPVSGDMVYNIVKRAGARAGLPKESVTPHALRRSNITLGGKRGVDLKKRQLAVGHASSSTTERYDKAREAEENAPGEVFADLAGDGE